MRKMHAKWIASGVGAFLLCATTASGAMLESASFLFGFGALSPPPISVVTSSGSSFGAGFTATLGAGVITGTGVVISLTASPPITQVILSVTGHASGSFVAGGGGLGNFGGAMPMAGTMRVLAYSGLVTLIGVPLSPVGNPGATFMTVTGGGGIIHVSGAGWTTGLRTLMVGATTISGAPQTAATVSLAGAACGPRVAAARSF